MKKFSEFLSLSGTFADDDLLLISVDLGGGNYETRKMTFLQLRDAFTKLESDLDVNSFSITSSSSGNIVIKPNGTGAVLLGGNSTQATELRFMEDSDNGTNYVALKVSAALAASTTYTLPTADGTSGQVLSTNGSGTLSWATAAGGLTVGTTAITSGTVGRILFEGIGNVLQQDSSLFWDNTNKRLGIGATPSTSVRLDVRAQGALSTDIGFRVRNSADTANILSVQGNGRIGVSTASPLAKLHISSDDFGQDLFRVTYTAGSVDMMNIRSSGFSTGTVTFAPPDGVVCNSTLKMGLNNILGSTTSYIQIEHPGGGNQSMNFRTASAAPTLGFQFLNSSGNQIFQITNSGNVVILNSSVIPSTNITDSFQQYSSDIVAGNAAPHFRTENGDIVKLYRVGGWGLPTGTFTRTTFDTATVTTAQLAERVAALIQDLRDNHQLLKA